MFNPGTWPALSYYVGTEQVKPTPIYPASTWDRQQIFPLTGESFNADVVSAGVVESNRVWLVLSHDWVSGYRSPDEQTSVALLDRLGYRHIDGWTFNRVIEVRLLERSVSVAPTSRRSEAPGSGAGPMK